MHEHVTFLRPEPPSSDPRRISAALPADLLEQVRERVRLLAVFLLIGFAVDPFFYFVSWAVARLSGDPIPPAFSLLLGFQLAQCAACAASAALWWVARNRRISASRLHTLGLAYEIVICFVLAITTFWNDYLQDGALPSLTWIPVVIILFPLILPGPPARMLAASIAAGATAPLALALLDVLNKVQTTPNNYVQTIFASTLAVGFAVMGSRIVYRLGREVAAARELGSYSLEERLGEGGMGEVWRARHRMLARPAAIKLIHPSIAGHGDIGVSEEALRRFEREAQVIARLRSPHTIDLFDFGIADNGAFYYAMELLDGLDAETLVRRFGPIPAERVVYLLRQVCHSLSEAESCGLVHRDIKPANIFLCRYGEECDFVKVLDFGLVKTVDDAAEVGPALTATGAHSGNAGLHGAGTGHGADQSRRPRRHLRYRLRGLLAAHRPDRLHVGDDHGVAPEAPSGDPGVAVDPRRAGPGRAREPRALVPVERPERSTAIGQGLVEPACRDRRPDRVDRGSRARMVGAASANPSVTRPFFS